MANETNSLAQSEISQGKTNTPHHLQVESKLKNKVIELMYFNTRMVVTGSWMVGEMERFGQRVQISTFPNFPRWASSEDSMFHTVTMVNNTVL